MLGFYFHGGNKTIWVAEGKRDAITHTLKGWLHASKRIIWHPLLGLLFDPLQGEARLAFHPSGKGPHVAVLWHPGKGTQTSLFGT
jgi:hypothetical protein